MSNRIQGGLWFRNHCLKITPYDGQGGTVTWQYPGEERQTSPYDDFVFTYEENCPNQIGYRTSWTGRYWDGSSAGERNSNNSSAVIGNLESYETRFVPYLAGLGTIEARFFTSGNPNASNDWIRVSSFGNGRFISEEDYNNGDFTFTVSERDYLASYCQEWYLKIINNGQTLVDRVTNFQPYVNRRNNTCRESNSELISLTTSPFGFIFMSEVDLNLQGQNQGQIPNNCINIYNVVRSIPWGNVSPTPSAPQGSFDYYEFVGQYCSSEGCDRPVVERNGDECPQGCPEGTCELNCGEVTCCYDLSTGISVASIPRN